MVAVLWRACSCHRSFRDMVKVRCPVTCPLSSALLTHQFASLKVNYSLSKKADVLRENENSPLKVRSFSIICCVPECFNNSRKNAKVNFIFPKEIALREKWIENIEREKLKVTWEMHQPYLRLCIWVDAVDIYNSNPKARSFQKVILPSSELSAILD